MADTGRPSVYSEEIAQDILCRLMDGQSLRKICQDDAMPARSTVHLWLANDEAFSDRYARARDAQADTLADEILDISDGENAAADPQRDRLRVDARKWLAGKLRPKVYGDKQQVEHSGGVTLSQALDVLPD